MIEPVFEEIADGFRVVLFNEKLEVAEKDGGVNGGVNDLFILISENPGVNTKTLTEKMDTPKRTIERWLKQLREEEKIEFRGAPKTGGYFVIDTSKV